MTVPFSHKAAQLLDVNSLTTPLQIDRPGQLLFGAGVAAQVGAWVDDQGARRVLVVADRFNAGRTGAMALPFAPVIFADLDGEPVIADLDSALAIAEQTRPDVVIGFGGGSAMDLAKLVAVLYGSGQGLDEVVGVNRVAGREVKLVQVATTAGTGSEAGTRALVSDPDKRAKLAVQSPHMRADLAVLDPELMTSLPSVLTAETGIDALAHCVEAYTNRLAHPLIDTYAEAGIGLIGRYLGRAVADGSDIEARAALALASHYGGYCLGPVNTAAGHAVAYPLSTWYGLGHGAANAVMFPHVLAFNAEARPEKTTRVLEALGLDAGGRILEQAMQFCGGLGIEMRLSARDVAAADFAAMADEAAAIRRLMDNNPRDVTAADVVGFYQAAG